MAGSSCSANCLRKAVSLFSWAGSLLRWPHAGSPCWQVAAGSFRALLVRSGKWYGLEGPQKVKHRTTL